MKRVKIVKPHKKYAMNQVVEVTNNEAHGLIDGGFAVMSKDMTAVDYKVNKVKRVKHGRTT